MPQVEIFLRFPENLITFFEFNVPFPGTISGAKTFLVRGKIWWGMGTLMGKRLTLDGTTGHIYN